MRILKVIHAWESESRGGTEVHAADVGRALGARGHQVGVFSRTARPGRPEYEVKTDAHGKIGITWVNNTFRDAPSFSWTYRNEAIHAGFEREIEEFEPDLVHIHHLTGLSTTIIEAVKARGLPCVVTLHDFWTCCPRGQRMMKDLHLCEDLDRTRCYSCLGGMWPHMFPDQESEPQVVNNRGEVSPRNLAEWDRHMAYILNLCDAIIVPSVHHRERMLEIPLDPGRVIAVPHGLDHAPFSDEARPLAPVRSIGFIGTVIPVKGVHVLIEAFLAMKRRDLKLEIFGEIRTHHDDLHYESRLRERIESASNITLRGAYEPEDVPGILKQIDVLVVPSLWWESFCLTIREGQLAGVPVLASDLGAMREALDGEQDGILFRAGDPVDLREKLGRIVEDDEYRAQYMNRGQNVRSMSDYVEELEEIYSECVRISRARRGDLVVAKPFFADDTQPAVDLQSIQLSAVPWDDIAVSMSQKGSAAFAVQTRLPSGEVPSLGLGVTVTGGGKEVGRLDLSVDLAPLGAALQGGHEEGEGGPEVPADQPAVVSESPEPAPEAEPAPSTEPAEPTERPRKRRRKSRSRRDDPKPAPPPQQQRERRETDAETAGTSDSPVVRRMVVEPSVRVRRHSVSAESTVRSETLPEGGLPTRRWDVGQRLKTRRISASSTGA